MDFLQTKRPMRTPSITVPEHFEKGGTDQLESPVVPVFVSSRLLTGGL